MKNINTIITLFSIILIIIFVTLKSVWIGFIYFGLIILMAICLYWIIVISINYIFEYKTNLLKDFNLFCAKLINSTNITSQMIEENKEFYIKKYKKSLIKAKLIEWLKILFLVAIIIISIIVISTGKIG